MNYLSDYQTFNNKHEMNEAVALHLSHNHFHLNSTEKEVLALLSRFSCKYAGVSQLKHETIEKKLEKSNSTIRRCIKKLEKLGIIKRIPFIRKVSKGFGANIYLILPFEQSHMDTRQESTISVTPTTEATKTDNEPYSLYKQNNFINNTYTQAPVSYPKTYYSRFKGLVESFLGEGNQKLVCRLFGIFKAQSIQMLKWDIFSDIKEQLEALAIQSLVVTMQSSKKKQIKSLTGYFNGTLKKMIDKSLYDLEGSESTEINEKPLFGYVNMSGEFVTLF
ncbi:helix-turn-helix domain-containing protein [Psychrobacillus sp. BM2]|uniref:helix-turn-helix domain-containing protein n=1 Tax=Psychrobacillus sp. BM2 TaxID=3400421 RepID=UPI003B01E782